MANGPHPTVHESLNVYTTKIPGAELALKTLPPGAMLAIITPKHDGKALAGAGWAELYGEVRPRSSDVEISRGAKDSKKASIDAAAFEPDAKSLALLRGVRLAREDLRHAGGAYDLEQVCTMMHGVSRQAIDKRVRDGTLFAVPGPNNRRRYPTVQFTADGELVEGLRDVSAALPSRNPWLMLNFLVNPDPRLQDRRPIDLLKAGEVGSVIESARRFGEQGA
jgi:hypothetical protein